LSADSRIAAARPELDARLKELARSLCGDFPELCDSAISGLLRHQIASSNADEGTVWLLDPAGEFLVPRFNTGENAERFVTGFRQSIREGMISMVVATEQPICENAVHANERQDKTLDKLLGLQTRAMLAVPLYYSGELRGVLSAVQLAPAGTEGAPDRGFSIEDLTCLQRTATILSRLIEHHLLLRCLGMEGVG
jgi:GAF domain-containing protein